MSSESISKKQKRIDGALLKNTNKKICLIGGKLQGVEVAYLAKEAGLFVTLIDKSEKPLCAFISDEFFCFDITEKPEKLIEISKSVDYIIPTNENEKAIETIRRLEKEEKLDSVVLFDFNAYKISSDKKLSKELFREAKIPTPKDNPKNPPYFVKPRTGSGSDGARIIYDKSELEKIQAESCVIEEYVKGPIVSLEIIGNENSYKSYKETRIHIDDVYDCSKVTPLDENKELREVTEKIALELKLKGIMDIEAIEGENGIKVMEIDARFPSQTPIAVLMSTGVNLLEELILAFDNSFEIDKNDNLTDNYGVFEHFVKVGNELISAGEHVISAGEKLRFVYRNETDKYREEIIECAGKNGYKAYTLIYSAKDEKDADLKQKKLLKIVSEL